MTVVGLLSPRRTTRMLQFNRHHSAAGVDQEIRLSGDAKSCRDQSFRYGGAAPQILVCHGSRRKVELPASSPAVEDNQEPDQNRDESKQHYRLHLMISQWTITTKTPSAMIAAPALSKATGLANRFPCRACQDWPAAWALWAI